MDSNNLATVAEVVMSIFASVPKIITAVEKPGNGVTKTAAVLTAATGTLNTLPAEVKDKIHVEQFTDTVQAITSAVVEINNLAGVFKKSEPAIPALPPAPEPAQPSVDIEALKKHIANMERRKAEFEASNAPDKQSRIDKLTKNIAEARAELASLE